MALEVEATYENGSLKLDHPVPLAERARVVVRIHPKESHAKRSAGLCKWTGDLEDLEYLLGPDNSSWNGE